MHMTRLFALVNPVVVSLAGSFAHWLISHQVMVLDVTGRRSGRIYRIPVSYLRSDGDVLCMTSRDGLWWRNLSKDVPVRITVAGNVFAASVAVVSDDDDAIAEALGLFCMRSRISAYFAGVGFDDDGKPRRSDLYRSAQQQVLIRLAPH